LFLLNLQLTLQQDRLSVSLDHLLVALDSGRRTRIIDYQQPWVLRLGILTLSLLRYLDNDPTIMNCSLPRRETNHILLRILRGITRQSIITNVLTGWHLPAPLQPMHGGRAY
jgi:hypothetical protein